MHRVRHAVLTAQKASANRAINICSSMHHDRNSPPPPSDKDKFQDTNKYEISGMSIVSV